MKKIIIFGAGSGGQKVYNFIKQFDEWEVCYFIDNYPKEDFLMGLRVIQANIFLSELVSREYYYCIASTYSDEIYNQLISFGIEPECIFSKIKFILNHENWFMDQLIEIDYELKQLNYKAERSIILDLLNGFGLGGVEKWSYNLATKYLCKREVLLLGNNSKEEPPDELALNSVKLDIVDANDYMISSIRKVIDFLIDKLPCTVFCAHVNDLLIACLALKKFVGNQLKIVSVIHGGVPHILKDNINIIEYVDYLLCVSPDSKKYIEQTLKRKSNNILFKESPVYLPSLKEREYTLNINEPLRIAYAARLEKTHKHSELLIPFITKLEEESIIYQLDIAGDGSLYTMLFEFVKNKNLIGKVNLLGRLDYDKMEDFWLSHDVAINFSECEGCSIAMLESMAAASVPIFTNVFSTDHFIKNGYNGFIVPFNDINKMFECIKILNNDREKLSIMGNRSREIIESKCSIDEYIRYFDKNILYEIMNKDNM